MGPVIMRMGPVVPDCLRVGGFVGYAEWWTESNVREQDKVKWAEQGWADQG